jgi:microcystin-dependent protein
MLSLPNDILNDTPADATPVEQNYSVIEQYINNSVINADGSVSMAAQLRLFGDPLNVNDAARKGYVDALLPVGVMLPFTGQVAPAGHWALCNGASLSTSTYPKAFAVLGYRYGGSGGTFMLPNMAGRVPIGMDTTQTEFSATGKKGGSFTVPVPLHSHTMAHTHEHPHTHPINHNHGSIVSTSAGAHTHTLSTSVRPSSGAGSTNSFMRAGTDGTTANITSNPVIDAASGHTHSVDLPNYAGSSGATSEATTGGSSAASTANAGTTGVELQPPFVVINYILRID